MTISIDDLTDTDFSGLTTGERLAAVTPGDVLNQDFLRPAGLSGRALARDLGVPPNRITEIIAGNRAISADTALLLAQRFGTSAEFWLNLQMMHDLEVARARHAA